MSCWPQVTRNGSYRLNDLAAVGMTPWTEVWGATKPSDGRSLPRTRPRRSRCRSRGGWPRGRGAGARAEGGGRPRLGSGGASTKHSVRARQSLSLFPDGRPCPPPGRRDCGRHPRPGWPWAGADVAAAAPQCFLVTGASCGLQKRCEHVEGKRFCPAPPDSGCRPGWHGRAFAEARVRAAVRSQRCLFGSQREGKGGAQCAPA